MAYEANRYDDPELEKARNDANNANNIRNAADVAIASGNPYAVGAGAVVKGLDKATGGASSEALGKAVSTANKVSPVGKSLQNASNRLNESGASDAIGNAAAMYNRSQGQGDTFPKKDPNVVNQPNASNVSGGEPSSSLPSSREKKSSITEEENKPKENDEEKEKKRGGLLGRLALGGVMNVVLFVFAPFLLALLVFVVIFASVTGVISSYEDAFGISQTTGEDTGNLYFKASTKEQQAFYDRVNDIKLAYQAQGVEIDPLKLVAVYHVLKNNGADLDYNDMTDAVIREFAEAMLRDGTYSEYTFKDNLIQTIIPRYLPKTTSDQRERIAQEVLDYVEDYYDLIGKSSDKSTTYCAANNCAYDIKGYAIRGKGNVTESIQVSDLYVRLMQCGTASGHNYGGVFGQPLEGEDLVPFEKYILGVTYNIMGEDAPEDAVKAQMVAARSYILARHADVGGWRTLEKSDDKWILQVAACSQDQVYCDPDKGCSGSSAQWGQIYSGLDHDNGYHKNPLPLTSILRTYSSQTSGEVVTNSDGYIVYTGYQQAEVNQFISLANSGLKYKQILLQVYNQGTRNYGASSVDKASCKADNTYCGVSSGEYAEWKQFEGPWSEVKIGSSGYTIHQIGCLATSVAILVAKSGVPTKVANFNPGTFVEYLSSHGGFAGGNFVWRSVSEIAPNFQFQGRINVATMSREEKLNKIKELVSQKDVYVVAEVKGNTGQHWVAIDSVSGDTVNMMDPGSHSTNLWQHYPWGNTTILAYFRVVR